VQKNKDQVEVRLGSNFIWEYQSKFCEVLKPYEKWIIISCTYFHQNEFQENREESQQFETAIPKLYSIQSNTDLQNQEENPKMFFIVLGVSLVIVILFGSILLCCCYRYIFSSCKIIQMEIFLNHDSFLFNNLKRKYILFYP
jgi:hypothetical protein